MGRDSVWVGFGGYLVGCVGVCIWFWFGCLGDRGIHLIVLALGKVEDDGSLCMLWMMRILKAWSNFG